MDSSTRGVSHSGGYRAIGQCIVLPSPHKRGLLQGRDYTTGLHPLAPLRAHTMRTSSIGIGRSANSSESDTIS